MQVMVELNNENISLENFAHNVRCAYNYRSFDLSICIVIRNSSTSFKFPTIALVTLFSLALYQVALCAINLSIDSSCNELILGTTCLFIE